MAYFRATAPTASAGFTSPPPVGMWLIEISRVRASIIDSSAATSSWPSASLGTIATSQPSRRARCR